MNTKIIDAYRKVIKEDIIGDDESNKIGNPDDWRDWLLSIGFTEVKQDGSEYGKFILDRRSIKIICKLHDNFENESRPEGILNWTEMSLLINDVEVEKVTKNFVDEDNSPQACMDILRSQAMGMMNALEDIFSL